MRRYRFPLGSSLAGVLLVGAVSVRAGALVQADDQAVRDSLSSGRAIYTQFCAPCHGPNGKGDGAVATYLLRPPSDITQLRRRNNGVFPRADLEVALLATAREETGRVLGREEVLWGPLFLSFGPEVARTRVAELIAYLESVQEP